MTDDDVADVLNRAASVTPARLARGQGWRTADVAAALERLTEAGRAQRVGVDLASGAYTYDPPPHVLTPTVRTGGRSRPSPRPR